MKRHALAILEKVAGGLAWGTGFAIGVVAVGYVADEVLTAHEVLKGSE
jgi:hypothetical protein